MESNSAPRRRQWNPVARTLRALCWPSDARIHFVIAGAQKSGTTALDFYLRTHHDVRMACVKETHFFDDDRAFANGKPSYRRYHSLFPPYKKAQIFGEATPIYMYWTPVFERIYGYNSKMKLIIVLRNPVERAYSHWSMERARGRESLPFAEAIRNEVTRCRKAFPHQHRRYSYVDRGFYSKQLLRASCYFPRDQLLVLRQDELQRNAQVVMDAVFRFIGVEPISIRHKQVHSRPYSDTMAPEDREYLMDIYADEIGRLERMLGWDCSGWLQGND